MNLRIYLQSSLKVAIVFVGLAMLISAGAPTLQAASAVNTLEATLRVMNGRGPMPGGQEKQRVWLTDSQGQTVEVALDQLQISSDQLSSLNGKKVKASLSGDSLLSVSPLDASASAAPAAGNPSGASTSPAKAGPMLVAPQDFMPTTVKRVVSILCKFSGSTTTTHNTAWVQGMMGSTYPGLDNYWREVSYNQMGIEGSTAVGWLDLPKTRAQYLNPQTLSFDLDSVRKDCITAANPQINFNNFDIVDMVFNQELDGYSWGSKECGLNAAINLDGNNGCLGYMWVSDTPGFQNQAIFAHEMGHAIGLPHSSAPYGGTYDSMWDVMSYGYGNYDATYGYVGSGMNGFGKLLLGWIPQDREGVADLQSIQTFDLERLNNPVSTANPLVLTLYAPAYNGSGGRLFTVESRFKTGTGVGVDSAVPGDAVIIHSVDFLRDNISQVVDSDADNNQDVNDSSAMWTVGETYTDPTYNFAVRVNSKSATSFNVSVASATPMVQLSAPTDGQYLRRGQAVNLTSTAASMVSTITKVEYYAGATKIGEASAAPYTVSWTPSVSGNAVLKAVAYDANGKSASSQVNTAVVYDISFNNWYSDGVGLTLKAPDIVVFNNRLYEVHRGNDQRIYVRSSPDTFNWTPWREYGGLTDEAVTMMVFNGRLYMVHRGTDRKIYTRYTVDGNNWTGWQEFGGTTDRTVYMESFNGRLYQTHRGDDRKIYTRFTSDGVNWSVWREFGGTTDQGVTLKNFNGRLYQTHRGDDQQIYIRSSADGVNWGGWVQFGGTTNQPVSMAVGGPKLYQTRVGTDNNIYTRYTTDGVNWVPWIQAPGNAADPIMMTGFYGAMYQVHRGLDNRIYLRTLS